MIADINCDLFCFSCELLAFHAEMSQMTADGWPSILEREGSLYTPTCIETVAKPPSYLAGLKTASIFVGPSLAGSIFTK